MGSDSNWIGIVANPGSGSGPNRERVDLLERSFTERGLEARVIWQPVEEVAELGDESCRCIVACGGDGTINRVINAPWRKPLAVLPLGTENLFARYFGFDGDVDTLVRTVEAGETRPIDIGHAGDRRFSLMISAGFDAEVIHRLDRWRTASGRVKRVRHASYARPIAVTLFRYRYPELTLTADGDECSGVLAMAFNTRMYALELGLMPDAMEDDGYLHWFVFQRPGMFRLFGFVKDALRGKHLQRRDVRYGRARELVISGDQVPVQLDGEAVGTTPVTVTVNPGALQVLRASVV